MLRRGSSALGPVSQLISAVLSDNMPQQWYEIVSAEEPLMQGDLILDCPVLAWKDEPFPAVNEGELVERLRVHFEGAGVDTVVMTQACDLAQNKVRNVTLCAHYALGNWKEVWQEGMKAIGQTPSSKAWRNQCEDIRNGFMWNLSMLNEADLGAFRIEHRIVDFHEVFTVPRGFLESLLRQRTEERPRLLPPYREHLSQAFARFYMRVGLPVDIAAAW